MYTGITALVCGDNFRFTSAISSVSVSSTSAITGIAPTAVTASAEAIYVYPGTITSSPGPMPIPISAEVSAANPEVIVSAYFAPVSAFHSSSKCCTSRPELLILKKSRLSMARPAASISSCPILYIIDPPCAVRRCHCPLSSASVRSMSIWSALSASGCAELNLKQATSYPPRTSWSSVGRYAL